MSRRQKEQQYKILISGAELVELKRHAHQIPECPGLDKRIQKYEGNSPFALTLHELGWLIAVLDAVINDPNGYPAIEHEPWKLRYVPKSDKRWAICKRLYDRLNAEEERIWDKQRSRMSSGQ